MQLPFFRTDETGRCRYPGASYSAAGLAWPLPDGVRVPQEQTAEHPAGDPFFAGGKQYAGIRALRALPPGFSKDAYGRTVFSYRERFPCFDSYDYMYEKRYYRWYLIFADGTLTRVFHADESPNLSVTEDVRLLENDLWDALQKAE